MVVRRKMFCGNRCIPIYAKTCQRRQVDKPWKDKDQTKSTSHRLMTHVWMEFAQNDGGCARCMAYVTCAPARMSRKMSPIPRNGQVWECQSPCKVTYTSRNKGAFRVGNPKPIFSRGPPTSSPRNARCPNYMNDSWLRDIAEIVTGGQSGVVPYMRRRVSITSLS